MPVPQPVVEAGLSTALFAEFERQLDQRGLLLKRGTMHKRRGGGPALTRWRQRHNAMISPTTAQVKGVFATLKRWMDFGCVRYRGLVKNSRHIVKQAAKTTRIHANIADKAIMQ